jgi:peptidoglycan/LPS O-acetylase OafA/YrhL
MGLLYLGQPTGWGEVSRYAVARFSRIAPPYLIVVVASFFIYTLVDPKFPYAIGTHNLLRHLLFSGNVSVFWSIPPEVQFYALFIALWWAVQRALQGRTGALIAVMAVVVLVVFVRDEVPGTFVISKLHYFLVGALLGGVHPWLRRVPISATALTVLQVALLATLGLFLLEVVHLPQNYWHDLAPALLAGLTVFAFSHDRTPIDAVFAARPFQWLGDWSFSVYLMHVPIIYLLGKLGLMAPGLTAFVGVSVAVAGCALFSIFIEHPACAFTKRRLSALLARVTPGSRPLLVPKINTDRNAT